MILNLLHQQKTGFLEFSQISSIFAAAAAWWNSQTRVRLQRVHVGVPAVVVDGVSFSHPQNRTLSREGKRKHREESNFSDGGASLQQTESLHLLEQTI